MAETAYIGVNGVAQKLSKMYVGDSNGIARKVTKGYIGVNGVARLFYTAHIHAYLEQSSYDFDDYINEDQHYYTKTCSCGDTITVWEDHGYDEYEEEATCTSDGYYMEFCPDCMKTFYYREYDATGHDYSAIETVEPTCTEQGYDIEQCRNCDATQNVNYVPELGHEEGEPVVVDSKAATCIEDGWSEEEVYCSRCGEYLYGGVVNIPATGHTAGAAATCTTPQKCTVCGEVIAPATGHSTYYKYLNDDNCALYCKNCYQFVDQDQGGTPHNIELRDNTATCTEGGHATRLCTKCGTNFGSVATDPLGHTYSTVSGKVICTRCGAPY